MNKMPSRYVRKATKQLLKLCPFRKTAVGHMTNFTQVSHTTVRNVLFCLFLIVKWVIWGFYGLKLTAFWTHCSEINGFLGTRGTHANRATVLLVYLKKISQNPLVPKFCGFSNHSDSLCPNIRTIRGFPALQMYLKIAGLSYFPNWFCIIWCKREQGSDLTKHSHMPYKSYTTI